MYKIKIISDFSGAHNLRNYKGKCEALHGHNWKVEVVVASSSLNDTGMVMDFSDLKKLTKEVIEKLDHGYLNDIEYFKKNNPCSEVIAKYIYDQLKPGIQEHKCEVSEVRVWETDTACAIYSE